MIEKDDKFEQGIGKGHGIYGLYNTGCIVYIYNYLLQGFRQAMIRKIMIHIKASK
jgi:hypothetical protein